LIELRERRSTIAQKLEQHRAQHERALLHGQYFQQNFTEAIEFLPNRPVLISVPSSVIENWMIEFRAWGYFGVSVYNGPSRELVLERVRNGVDEVLVCSHHVFVSPDDLKKLMTIHWSLIVVDEAHKFKVSLPR
jgi:SNF2 family DNA or RNA helicase